MFYTFRQSRVNGIYIVSGSVRGYVCIEGDASNIDARMKEILMPTQEEKRGCGKRWHGAETIEEEPYIRDMPLREYIQSDKNMLRHSAIIHYVDGTVEEIAP